MITSIFSESNLFFSSSTDMKNTKSETVPVDADAILARREEDLKHFMLRMQQIDTLIKMIGKVTESIIGRFTLEQIELKKSVH